MKKNIVWLLCSLFLSSCSSSFWEGMAAGMSTMGGGMYGGAPMMYGGVPYGLQPNVAVERSAAVINNNLRNTTVTGEQIMMNEISNQLNGDIWKNGVPVTPVAAPATTNIGNTGLNSAGSSTTGTRSSSSGTTCYLCHGLKKCWTCNGNRTYLSNGKYIKCPNCTDGLCSHCHGTGLK